MRHPAAAAAAACIRMLRPCHFAGVRTAAGAGHDRNMRAAKVDIVARRRSHAAGAAGAAGVVDKASGRHREVRGYRRS